MTLREVILNLDSVVAATPPEALEDAVVFADVDSSAWQPETKCIVRVEDGEETIVVVDAAEWFYFLEITVLREVVEGWRDNFNAEASTDEDLVNAVIYYARFDALPPP